MNDGEASPLRVAAIQAHEMYVELRGAGFARGEAIELLAKMLIGTVGEQTGQDGDND